MQENGEGQGAGEGAPGAPPPPQPPVKAPGLLPAIASGGIVLFPGLMLPLASADAAVVQAVVEAAASPSKMLALFAQKPGAEGHHNGEPYAMGTAASIVRMMRDINRETGTTFVLVTHDPEVAGTCDRAINMLDGKVT